MSYEKACMLVLDNLHVGWFLLEIWLFDIPRKSDNLLSDGLIKSKIPVWCIYKFTFVTSFPLYFFKYKGTKHASPQRSRGRITFFYICKLKKPFLWMFFPIVQHPAHRELSHYILCRVKIFIYILGNSNKRNSRLLTLSPLKFDLSFFDICENLHSCWYWLH